MRRVAILIAATMLVFLCAGVAVAGETTVGGTIKFFLYDQSDGEITHWDVGDQQSVTESSKNSASAGLSQVILNFYREIAEDWAIEAQPELRWSAGATPRLGAMEIDRDPSSETHVEIIRAAVIWQMPADFEMKAGYLKPLFTWDYGYELFWDEQFNAYFVTANPMLGSWHDVGAEFYKNFEGDSYSIPTYVYLLNGPMTEVSGQTDDNWTFLLHTAPEFMSGNLKFLGSIGYGGYDDDQHAMTRYAIGADFTHQAFNIRGEYIGATYEALLGGTDDGTPWGWYTKAFYNVTPTWVLLGGYSQLEHNYTSFGFSPFPDPMDETYTQWTLGANWQPADGVTVMFAYDYTDGERTGSIDLEDEDEPQPTTLSYGRINLGVRATF